MSTTIDHREPKVGARGEGAARAVAGRDGAAGASRLSGEQVWRALAKASFAVLGYVTPSGEPRSSGVVYKTVGRRLYVAVAPDSWKAKHVAASGRIAVTVPVRRGRDPVSRSAHPTRNHQLPRVGDRAPGRLATGSPALE